jgi:hypothetical protein
VFGDYRLIQELGRGGMGVVFEAEQTSLSRRVALKLLSPHHNLSPTAQERFRREAEAGARLRHPGIVTVHAVGEESGVHYIAQELVPAGYSLGDLLAQDPRNPDSKLLTFPEVAELFARIADALQAAHEAGVIHRDIKPSNILLDEARNPKVADFGLAKVVDQLALSRSGDLAGTPFYRSPEQARSNKDIDHRTDLFSLGASLYEALTHRRAFEGDTGQLVLQKILDEDPVDPRRIRSQLPVDLSVICLKCLEKRPQERYSSMAEFADDLRRFLRHEPIAAVASRRVKCCISVLSTPRTSERFQPLRLRGA